MRLFNLRRDDLGWGFGCGLYHAVQRRHTKGPIRGAQIPEREPLCMSGALPNLAPPTDVKLFHVVDDLQGCLATQTAPTALPVLVAF